MGQHGSYSELRTTSQPVSYWKHKVGGVETILGTIWLVVGAVLVGARQSLCRSARTEKGRIS
jgi:hypothetical protein